MRRVERRHMEDAAEEIVNLIQRLPTPLREVAVRRASGLSWRKICEALPDRAQFSLEDDWSRVLWLINKEAADTVKRLV